MEYISVGTIAALVLSTLESCRTVQLYPDEVARVAARLALVLSKKGEWEDAIDYDGPSGTIAGRVYSVLCDIFLCVQAAGYPHGSKRSDWSRKLKFFFLGKEVLGELLHAESNLEDVLKDLGFAANMKCLFRIDACKQGFDRLKVFFEILDTHYDFTSSVNNLSNDTAEDAFSATISDLYSEKYETRSIDTCTFHISDEDTASTIDISMDESLAIDVNRLIFIANIGFGGFAKVYEGLYDGDKVAIKSIQIFRNCNVSRYEDMVPSVFRSERERVRDEALIMHQCSIHPNIVDVFGYHAPLDYKSKPLIVMELMELSLNNILHNRHLFLRYVDLLMLMKGVASAIQFLHLQGIVHQDIKSSNILVNHMQMVAKLTDFGVAYVKGDKTTWHNRHNTIVTSTKKNKDDNLGGTCIYQAPELILNEVEDVSRVAEIYSFGVTIWECLTREIPHNGVKSEAERKAKTAGMLMLPFPVARELHLSLEENNSCLILERTAFVCLSKNRSERPNASQALCCLNGSPAIPDEMIWLPFDPDSGYDDINNVMRNDQDRVGANKTSEGTESCLKKRRRLIAIISVVGIVAVIATVAFVILLQSPKPTPTSINKKSQLASDIPASLPTPSTAPIPSIVPIQTLVPIPTTVPIITKVPIPTMVPLPSGSDATPPSGSSPKCFRNRDQLRTSVVEYLQGGQSVRDTYGDPIGKWCVDYIEDFSFLFQGSDEWYDSVLNDPNFFYSSETELFNEDISTWNTSSAKNMSYMFAGTSSFNQDLSSWNVGSVTDMWYMFAFTDMFNQNIGFWDVSSVRYMQGMFLEAAAFNQNISQWNVSSVIDMQFMFGDTQKFNQSLASWDVSAVTNMYGMFSNAAAFNQDLSTWDVSSVIYMSEMFYNATSFNQDLSTWNVESVNDMRWMFQDARIFNHNLCRWGNLMNISTDVYDMFHGAEKCTTQEDPQFDSEPYGPFCAACRA